MDYADPANPRIVCTFGRPGVSIVQIVDARHVVISAQGVGEDAFSYAIVDLPEVRYRWFHTPFEQRTGAYPAFIAVSPALDRILWLIADPVGSETDEIHITTTSADRVLATVPDTNTGRCGSSEDSKIGAFASASRHLFVLTQPDGITNSLIVADGETAALSMLPPTGGWPVGANPAVAVWSPTSATLYYRKDGDVWTWTEDAGPKRFLAGVRWLHPTISPDGRRLAFAVQRPDGLHGVYLVDLVQGGSPTLIGGGARKLPAFLNPTQLWFRSEAEDFGCAGMSEDRPLIYDVLDGSESPSNIEQVLWAWPATSSNF